MVGLLILCLVSGRVKRALISSHCTSWAVLISGSGLFDPILDFKETGTRYVPMRWIDREVAQFMSSEALLPRWANQEEGVVGGAIWPPPPTASKVCLSSTCNTCIWFHGSVKETDDVWKRESPGFSSDLSFFLWLFILPGVLWLVCFHLLLN